MFKPGDKVVCIDDSELPVRSIEQGKTYTVKYKEAVYSQYAVYLKEFPNLFFFDYRFRKEA